MTALLEVRGVCKRFGGIVAVDDVTFDLRRGETLGLIGPNGAGKTTVLDLISGVLQVDLGRIELGGVDIGTWSASRRSVGGLGRSFQDARIFPSLTVSENIAMGLERHIANRDHLAALLDLPTIQQSERQVGQRVEELIEVMNLQSYRDKFVAELSTGVRCADLHVLDAVHPPVHVRLLERTDQAEAGDLRHAQSRDLASVEADRAAVDRMLAGD